MRVELQKTEDIPQLLHIKTYPEFHLKQDLLEMKIRGSSDGRLWRPQLDEACNEKFE